MGKLLNPSSFTASSRVLLAGVLMAGGCASSPPAPHSMQAPQANFAAFQTFTWDGAQGAAGSTEPISILDSHIRAAISSELQQKGYTEAQAGKAADLVLQYETAAAEKVKSSPFRIGIGMGGVGNSGAAGVGVSSSPTKEVREGTLVLRVVDPARNAEVWNGRVSRELSKTGPPDPALIQSAVRDLLKSFPVRTSGVP